MDRHRLIFLLVISVAVLARLIVLIHRADDLSTDPDGYIAHARMLQAGQGFAGPYTGAPTAFRPPGYPLLIAVSPLSGTDPQKSIAMLHLAVGVLTVVLTRHLADQLGLAADLGNLAAALVSLDPLLLRYSAFPMTEVLSAALLTAAVSAFVAFRRNQLLNSGNSIADTRTGLRRQTVYGVVSGILFGLGALVRPICLIVAALLTVSVLISELLTMFRRRTTAAMPDVANPAWSVVARTMIPLVLMTLTISPWILRNLIQFQHFIPATTHGGYTLALGNNADYYRDVVQGAPGSPWDGDALGQWQRKMLESVAQAGISTLDEPAADAWMYRQAITSIREQPSAFLSACLLRLRMFFSIGTAAETKVSRPLQLAAAFWYATMWMFVAIAGLSTLRGHSGFSTSELWLTIVAFVLIHSVYWTDARMRAPLMPLFAVLSCLGGIAAWNFLRNGVVRFQSRGSR